MFEWSEDQLAIRDAVRRFVEEEVKPNVEELEHGDTPPYEVIRKLYRTFGLDALARDSFKRALERKTSGAAAPARSEGGGNAAMTLIPIIELCHYCPGIVTALGVSTGLAGGTIMKGGTPAQMERWGLDLFGDEPPHRIADRQLVFGPLEHLTCLPAASNPAGADPTGRA